MRKILFTLATAMMMFAFVSCDKETPNNNNNNNNNNNDPEVPTPTELTFEFEVSDLTATSATVTAIPSDQEASYYMDCATLEEVESMGGEEAFMEFIVDALIELGAEEGYSVEETLEILLSVGTDSWTPSGMTPGSSYIVFAFGVEYDGTITTEFFYEEFTTLSNSEPNPSVDQYLGTWEASFESSVIWAPGEDGYYYINENGVPMTRTLTITPYTEADATGSEVIISGLSVLGDGYPALGIVDEGILYIMAGLNIGQDESGAYMTWCPVCTLTDGSLTVVTGQFPAFTIEVDGTAGQGTPNQVELQGGEVATVYSLDLYGLTAEGQLSSLYSDQAMAAGPFTLTQVSPATAKASSLLKKTAPMQMISSVNPSYSVVR